MQADLAATGRAFQLVEQVNGWTLVSDPACAAWVRQLYPEAKPTRLTGPQLETLAIIAYRQPVTRADCEAVRGVAVDGVMQILLDRGLVKIAGRAEVPGPPAALRDDRIFPPALRPEDDRRTAECERAEARRRCRRAEGRGSAASRRDADALRAEARRAAAVHGPPRKRRAAAVEPTPPRSSLPNPEATPMRTRIRASEPDEPDSRMKLPEIRQKIDALDDQLIQLLNERADLVHEVGLVKRAEGTEIYAPEREETLLRALAAKNAALQGPAAGEIDPRHLPRNHVRLARAGEGSDHRLLRPGGDEHPPGGAQQIRRERELHAAQVSIADVFDVVARGNADYGVVPIENSTEGAVNHTLDVFMDSELRICAQILMKIENHLVAKIPRDADPQASTRTRRSSASAATGCGMNLPERRSDRSLQHAARGGTGRDASRTPRAIAGAMAAEVHGLQVLAPSIQDIAEQHHALPRHRPQPPRRRPATTAPRSCSACRTNPARFSTRWSRSTG